MEPKKQTNVHTCRFCSSPLVQPAEWNRLEEQCWEVLLRCPECWESYAVILDQEEVNEFSYYLECAFKALLDSLEELDREAFEAECDHFIAAVWSNHILPMDF